MENGENDWVTLSGTSHHCRVDHNDFGPQSQVGNMIQLGGMGAQIVQYSRVDHNFFHDVKGGGGNDEIGVRVCVTLLPAFFQ